MKSERIFEEKQKRKMKIRKNYKKESRSGIRKRKEV